MDEESDEENFPPLLTSSEFKKVLDEESEEDGGPLELELLPMEPLELDLCPNLTSDIDLSLSEEPKPSSRKRPCQESCPEGAPATSSDVVQPQPIQVVKATENISHHLPDALPFLDISCSSSLTTELAQTKRQPSHEHAKILVQDEEPCGEVFLGTMLPVSNIQQSNLSDMAQDLETLDNELLADVGDLNINDFLDYENNREDAGPEPEFEPFRQHQLEEEEMNEDSDSENIEMDSSKEVPIYEGASVTVWESLVAILTFMQCEHLSGVGLKRLLSLINLFLPQPNNFFTSHKRFFKLIEDLDEPVTFHYFCSVCQRIVKSPSDLCDKCTDENRSVNFFMTFSVTSQLSKMFKRPEFVEQLKYKNTRTRKNTDCIEDLYDAEVYRKVNEYLSKYDVTFTWNADGLQIFKSNNYSLWPFFLVVNELPPEKRFLSENLVVAGLWGSLHKPRSYPFLLPIYKEIKSLMDGVDVEVYGEDKPQRVRVRITCGTCDAPARATFMNMKLHSGFYSCPVCLIKGQSHDTVVFPYQENIPLRNMVQYEEHKKNAVVNKVVLQKKLNPRLEDLCCGIKGPTILSNMVPDLFECTAIDSMHCIYLGVMRSMLELWFDKDHKEKAFSVHSKSKLVSLRIKNLQPPHFLQRRPQSVEKLIYWKATELRSFLFNLSLVVLKDVLKPEYYNHFALFVEGIGLLNSDSISQNDIDVSFNLLSQFVKEFAALYGVRYMTHNLHMLLHLPRCVQLHGALWIYSCFKFEDINGRLTKLIHGTKHVSLQIHHSMSIVTGLPLMIKGLRESRVKEYCTDLVHKRQRLKVSKKVSKGLHCVGDFYNVTDKNSWVLGVLTAAHILTSNVKLFYRLRKDKIQIHSSFYSRGERVSSYVQYRIGETVKYGNVEVFVKIDCNCGPNCTCGTNSFRAIIRPVSVQPFKVDELIISHLYNVVVQGNVYDVINLNDVETVVFKLECEGSTTLSKPLNKFELE